MYIEYEFIAATFPYWKDQDAQEGVNWTNSKFSYNNQILRIAQLTPCA